MKLLCLGDLHYRATAPSGRTDDYVETLFGKMNQALKLAISYGCEYILQPGDFFDQATAPYWLTRRVIMQHRGPWPSAPPLLLVVLGQHDQRYHHGDRDNTPIGVLEAAGVVRVLGDPPYRTSETPRTAPGGGQNGPVAALNDPQVGRRGAGPKTRRKPTPVELPVEFYGASWGEDISSPPKGGAVRVLLTHRMVIQDKLLWPGQEDYSKAGALLRRHPYDLIVTGDNHHFFVEKLGDRYLVNCGSLMRANTDQADHHPSVVIYDTEARTAEVIRLKVAPAAKVLRTEQAEEVKRQNVDLEAFVEQIGSNRGSPDLDFVATLKRLVKDSKAPTGVVRQVDTILEMSSHEQS